MSSKKFREIKSQFQVPVHRARLSHKLVMVGYAASCCSPAAVGHAIKLPSKNLRLQLPILLIPILTTEHTKERTYLSQAWRSKVGKSWVI